MHRYDYWSGFFTSMSAHKELIKETFLYASVTKFMFDFSLIKRCLSHVLNVVKGEMKEQYDSSWNLSRRLDFCNNTVLMNYVISVYSQVMDASIGAHHDSITGTSTVEVHAQENDMFSNVNVVTMNLLGGINQGLHRLIHMNTSAPFKQEVISTVWPMAFDIQQFGFFNGNLQKKSEVLWFDYPMDKMKIDPKVSDLQAFYAGKQLEAFIRFPWIIKGDRLVEDNKTMQVGFNVQDIEPISASLLTFGHVFNENYPKEKDYKTYQQKLTPGLNDYRDVYMENDYIRVTLDDDTKMPK